MAYAAVVSLKHTIEHLLNSSHISIVPPSPEIIELAHRHSQSLQETLKRLDWSSSSSSRRKRVNALDGQIREAVCKFEDELESHVSNQIVSQSESLGGESHPLLFSIDLQDLKLDIHSFTETVKKMEDEYNMELRILPEEEEEEEDTAAAAAAAAYDDEALSSRTNFGGNKSKMVGLADQFHELKNMLTNVAQLRLELLLLIGMTGIGKTTLAREIFEDPDILSHFPYRAWAKVGRKRKTKDILLDILAQVNPGILNRCTVKMLMEAEYEEIYQNLKNSLMCRRYLIVLDDAWETGLVWALLDSFPDYENGSRVLVTTRLQEDGPGTLKMRLLNKEESWDLLREKVFAEELCPPQLEKAGKKIAENCEGLPLTIVTVADLLSKAEKTPEYWNKVAEKQNSLFVDAYDEISKVLFPTYDYLSQQFKVRFLCMGVFPQNYKIPTSKLKNMWTAEGFDELSISAEDCLQRLVYQSLVMIYQNSTISPWVLTKGIKTCGLHSSWWHLCNREARKNKFLHVLNSCADGLAEGIKSQRRLCIHNNVLFGIKDVYKSMEDYCASTARSLLCVGPYHQYQVPICFGLRLLKILDALTIRLYEFPVEVLKLVQLRYLALTYNGNIPDSISKLWKLQFLIVGRHLNIKSSSGAAPSYLPLEIWDMQELKHLQVMGSNLLHDHNCGALLPNLLRLLDVSAHSCTKGVLRRIRNLKKLGIRIEMAPNDDSKSLGCLNRISRLRRLESLKCVVVNPEFKSEFVPPPAPRSMFPSSLKKLYLSGFGYPWEYMSVIASLPYLQALKLRCYAFRGPKWEIHENGFLELKFLLIEDTDLVQWKVGRGSFPCLDRLSIKHCYKLQNIGWPSDGFPKVVEIVDCNVLSADTEGQIKEANSKKEYPDFYVHSSLNDGNLKP